MKGVCGASSPRQVSGFPRHNVYDGYPSDESFVICGSVATANNLFAQILREPWGEMVERLEESGKSYRKVDGEWTDAGGRTFAECIEASEFDDKKLQK